MKPGGGENGYGSTYNCLACPDNRLTYNDGYHVLHHLNSKLHWSEVPCRFIDTLEAHDVKDGGLICRCLF